MLLGQEIRIYTDHKNLTYPSTDFTSDRILRQRLVIEEYGAALVYVPGDNNFVVDTLSRNDTAAETLEEKEKAFLSEEYFLNRRVFGDSIKCPIDLSVIKEAHDIDSNLSKRQGQIWKEDVQRGRNLDRVNEKRRQPHLRAG